MPWNQEYRSHCKVCERRRESGERFSARGKCPVCGHGHMVANYLQLKAHNGPYWQHWRKRTLAAFGIGLPDE